MLPRHWLRGEPTTPSRRRVRACKWSITPTRALVTSAVRPHEALIDAVIRPAWSRALAAVARC